MLTDAGLGGYLPWDNTIWSSLKSLSNVDLSGNSIEGYIPPQIVDGLGLQTLGLRNNSLQGPLPTAMSQELQIMDASTNQLTGTDHMFHSRLLVQKPRLAEAFSLSSGVLSVTCFLLSLFLIPVVDGFVKILSGPCTGCRQHS